jgi:hypothetical protein
MIVCTVIQRAAPPFWSFTTIMKKKKPSKKLVKTKKPVKAKKSVGKKTPKTGRQKRSEPAVAPIDRNPLPAGTAAIAFILFRCYAKSMSADAAREECCLLPGLANTTVEQVETLYQEFEKLCRVLAKLRQNPPKPR